MNCLFPLCIKVTHSNIFFSLVVGHSDFFLLSLLLVIKNHCRGYDDRIVLFIYTLRKTTRAREHSSRLGCRSYHHMLFSILPVSSHIAFRSQILEIKNWPRTKNVQVIIYVEIDWIHPFTPITNVFIVCRRMRKKVVM